MNAAPHPRAKAHHPALHTRICDLFGIEYPIIQTGMGWVSGARLTAATSRAGGLGILASATMTFPELEKAIDEVKARTDKPFGVNLRADQDDIDARVDLLIRAGVKVASFAQAPRKEVIQKLKDHGLKTMPTIGARRHAEKVAAWASTPSSPRGTRAAATPALCPHRSSSPRSPPRWTSPCSAPGASSTAGAWSPRWPTAPAGSPWAPASSSPRRAPSPTR